MTTFHTPGHWRRQPGAYGALYVGPATLPHPGKDRRDLADLLAKREADAALLEAAPDLLAVARAAAGCPQAAPWLASQAMPGQDRSIWDALQDALAVATVADRPTIEISQRVER